MKIRIRRNSLILWPWIANLYYGALDDWIYALPRTDEGGSALIKKQLASSADASILRVSLFHRFLSRTSLLWPVPIYYLVAYQAPLFELSSYLTYAPLTSLERELSF